MRSSRLCSINIDLDEIPNYFALHGLDPPGDGISTLVYDVALGRLRQLAEDVSVPLTLFAIGSDLKREPSANALRLFCDRGDEIANHTLDHRYDLIRLEKEEIRRQIQGGGEVIAQAVGVYPIGFRSPGYNVSDALFTQLQDLGVEYDASLFSSPLYLSAKACAVAWIGLRRRESRSILAPPWSLLAPTTPYRIGRPYWKRGEGLIELPIQVTPYLRIPLIGTFLAMAGVDGARLLARMCAHLSFVQIELHGIDLLDAEDGLDALRPHQPDVRVKWRRKVDAIAAAIDVFRQAGFSFVTLQEASRSVC